MISNMLRELVATTCAIQFMEVTLFVFFFDRKPIARKYEDIEKGTR